MGLRAPDGTGIKGGKAAYHAQRMLVALSFVESSEPALNYPETLAFAEQLAVYHARLAARAALNGLYNGRRPQ